MTQQFITKRRAAEQFDVHPETIMRWVKNRPGFPRPVYMGPDVVDPHGRPCKAGIRFRADEIEAYQESLSREVFGDTPE